MSVMGVGLARRVSLEKSNMEFLIDQMVGSKLDGWSRCD